MTDIQPVSHSFAHAHSTWYLATCKLAAAARVGTTPPVISSARDDLPWPIPGIPPTPAGPVGWTTRDGVDTSFFPDALPRYYGHASTSPPCRMGLFSTLCPASWPARPYSFCSHGVSRPMTISALSRLCHRPRLCTSSARTTDCVCYTSARGPLSTLVRSTNGSWCYNGSMLR